MEFELEKDNAIENAVSSEVALNDLRDFVKEHTGKNLEDDKLIKQYPAVLTALENGNLVLGDSPVYELRKPVQNDKGEDAISEIKFKTRILPSEQRKIAKGLDLNADQLLYGHRCVAFVTGLPTVNLLDKLGKIDYSVLEQLSTLFT